MTLSLIGADPVLDTRIRMVLLSKGLTSEIRNPKTKDIFVPIKNS